MTAVQVKQAEMSFDQFDFEGYEESVEASKSLPFAQLITPFGQKLNDVKGRPFGIFIKQDNLDAVDFQGNHRWTQTEIVFDNDGTEIVEPGLICVNPRMAIVRKSGIKVFGKNAEGQFNYLGEAYNKGKLTEVGLKAKEDPQNHNFRTLHLVYFLDNDNTPLHSSPLQFTTKGAFGGAFGVELSNLHREINGCFFKAARKANPKFKAGQLNQEALSLAVFDFTINLRKSEKGAVACSISSRLAPSIDEIGKSKTVKRNVDIELQNVDWRSIYIHKQSETGQVILDTYNQYADFGASSEPQSNNGGETHLVGTVFRATGNILSEPKVEFFENGDVVSAFELTFNRGGQFVTQWCECEGANAEMIADGWKNQRISLEGTYVESLQLTKAIGVEIDIMKIDQAPDHDDDMPY